MALTQNLEVLMWVSEGMTRVLLAFCHMKFSRQMLHCPCLPADALRLLHLHCLAYVAQKEPAVDCAPPSSFIVFGSIAICCACAARLQLSIHAVLHAALLAASLDGKSLEPAPAHGQL